MLALLTLVFFSSWSYGAGLTQCQTFTEEESCRYRACLVPKSTHYPRPTLILIPLEAPKPIPIHLHFHGWAQDQDGSPRNPIYDFDWTDRKSDPTLGQLRKFWNAYGLHYGTCSSKSEIIAIPLSRGHNEDYDAGFPDSIGFSRYLVTLIESLSALLGSKPEIHLSAHSGGGKILARILDLKNEQITRIKLFDATYSSFTSTQMIAWLNAPHENHRTLEVYSVTPQTAPFSNAIKIKGNTVTDGPVTETRTQNSSLKIEFTLDGALDHYQVVGQHFVDDEWAVEWTDE